jgi:hypothetical protein
MISANDFGLGLRSLKAMLIGQVMLQKLFPQLYYNWVLEELLDHFPVVVREDITENFNSLIS